MVALAARWRSSLRLGRGWASCKQLVGARLELADPQRELRRVDRAALALVAQRQRVLEDAAQRVRDPRLAGARVVDHLLVRRSRWARQLWWRACSKRR